MFVATTQAPNRAVTTRLGLVTGSFLIRELVQTPNVQTQDIRRPESLGVGVADEGLVLVLGEAQLELRIALAGSVCHRDTMVPYGSLSQRRFAQFVSANHFFGCAAA